MLIVPQDNKQATAGAALKWAYKFIYLLSFEGKALHHYITLILTSNNTSIPYLFWLNALCNWNSVVLTWIREKYFPHEENQAWEQVSQSGCAISILGGYFKDLLIKHWAAWSGLVLIWAGAWAGDVLRSLCTWVLLWVYELMNLMVH